MVPPARMLHSRAWSWSVSASDLVVVHPWFCAVSLSRYYTGAAEIVTLPPLTDARLQRLDLFKQQIANDRALDPVFTKLGAVLRGGGTVWLVGHFPFTNPPQPPPMLPPAGKGPEGWRGAPYMMAYGMQVAYFIQMHATESASVEITVGEPVHPFEDLPVRSVAGWRASSSLW